MRAKEAGGPPVKREAFYVLKGIHQTIQNHCGESSRRCWEYLVEMLAHTTGWKTETCESKALWEPMYNEHRWIEFAEAWVDEVTMAKENRTAFSEPIGQLLEHIEGTNLNRSQHFTPMVVVRAMNEINFCDIQVPEDCYLHGLDPSCGTGRMMLDALVFNDKLIMANCDIDLWLLRVAKLNARILGRWTTLRKPYLFWDAMLAGRARFIWGNSLTVDLRYSPNWSLSWHWTPQRWQDDLKIEGYLGTLSQWEDEGRPKLEMPGRPGDVQFDYSMKGSPKDKTSTRSIHGGKTTPKLARGPDPAPTERSRTSRRSLQSSG